MGTDTPQPLSNAIDGSDGPAHDTEAQVPDLIEVDGEWFLVWPDARLPQSVASEAEGRSMLRTMQQITALAEVSSETA
jgi:hypothetical protein